MKINNIKLRTDILSFIMLTVCALCALLVYTLFQSKHYMFMSVLSAVVCCLFFYIHYEITNKSSLELVHLCSVIALSVAGRCVFAPLPFFKPVTAIVVISGLYFGSEFAFVAGSLSALLSNFLFSQGPWTPFQMFAWGICGFFAGLLSRLLLKNKLLLCIYAAFTGVLYSLITDINTVLWIEGVFNFSRYLAVLATSIPFCITYAVSNVVFVLILGPILGKTFLRLKTKFG